MLHHRERRDTSTQHSFAGWLTWRWTRHWLADAVSADNKAEAAVSQCTRCARCEREGRVGHVVRWWHNSCAWTVDGGTGEASNPVLLETDWHATVGIKIVLDLMSTTEQKSIRWVSH